MKKKRNSVVEIDDIAFGDGSFEVVAGPCAVESEEQIHKIAKELSGLGIRVLRGGSFKARTSPYTFQGMGEEALRYLSEAAKSNSMKCVSEFLSIEQLTEFHHLVDIVQIGARNMYNYPLLRAAGSISKPVLLKRAFSATYEEWYLAAEYIISSGNPNVILCERGIRTFEVATRNTFDINAVSYMKEKSKLPIICDPSHAAGLREHVPSLSYAALAAGADGIMVETHYEPENALSDGRQTLSIGAFSEMNERLARMAALRKTDWY